MRNAYKDIIIFMCFVTLNINGLYYYTKCIVMVFLLLSASTMACCICKQLTIIFQLVLDNLRLGTLRLGTPNRKSNNAIFCTFCVAKRYISLYICVLLQLQFRFIFSILRSHLTEDIYQLVQMKKKSYHNIFAFFVCE